eukprot:m.54781 g.54781  ORF g.54781 m.54781 type:complete len:105 (+) comp48805_c0_seq1:3-317(+)
MLWLGVVAIVAVAAAAPARPQLSADFQAQISLLYVTGAQELLGTGHWLIDSTKNMGVQVCSISSCRASASDAEPSSSSCCCCSSFVVLYLARGAIFRRGVSVPT